MRRMGLDMSRTKEAFNEALERTQELQRLEMRAAACIVVDAQILVARFPNDEKLKDLRESVEKLDKARAEALAQLKFLGEVAADGA